MVDMAVLPGFLVAVLVIVFAPGPDNAYIVAVAVVHGPRAGVVSAAGMAIGMVVHVTVAALGLTVLVTAVPWTLDVIRLAGAAYLAWLAVDTLRSAGRGEADARVPATVRTVMRRATLTNLANPKVILFIAAFLPHFVRPGHGPMGAQMLTLGVIFLLIGLAGDSIVGLAAGRLRTALAPGSRAGTVVTVLAGLTFATLAVLLVVDAVSG